MASKKTIIINFLVSAILLIVIIFVFEIKRESLYIELTEMPNELFKDYDKPFASSYNFDGIHLEDLKSFSEIPDRLKNNSYKEIKYNNNYFLVSPTWFSKVVVLIPNKKGEYIVETFICDIISTSISPDMFTYYTSEKLQVLEDKLKEEIKNGLLVANIVANKNGEIDYNRIQPSDKAINELLDIFTKSNKYYYYKVENLPNSYDSKVFGGTLYGKYGCRSGNFNTFKNYYGDYSTAQLNSFYTEKAIKYFPKLNWKNYIGDIGKYFAILLILQILTNLLITMLKKQKE